VLPAEKYFRTLFTKLASMPRSRNVAAIFSYVFCKSASVMAVSAAPFWVADGSLLLAFLPAFDIFEACRYPSASAEDMHCAVSKLTSA
jgi:hypothetical protein